MAERRPDDLQKRIQELMNTAAEDLPAPPKLPDGSDGVIFQDTDPKRYDELSKEATARAGGGGESATPESGGEGVRQLLKSIDQRLRELPKAIAQELGA